MFYHTFFEINFGIVGTAVARGVATRIPISYYTNGDLDYEQQTAPKSLTNAFIL